LADSEAELSAFLRGGLSFANVPGIAYEYSNLGFGTEWHVLPDYGIGIISCANLTYAGMRTQNVAALDTLIALAGLKPRTPAPSAILLQRKTELVRLLPDFQDAENSGIFAENFFPDTPTALRRKQTQEVFAKIGKVIRVEEIIPENTLRGMFRIVGERGTLSIFFTLTPEAPSFSS
jgi:hypothetical protein